MKIARFWTRADDEFGDVRVTARGWSDESIDAARAKAREIARRVAERVAGGFGKAHRYPYGDRPLPEPVIRELAGAIVTRNVYGALVLNTDHLMFVDVDRKESPKPAGSGGLFSSLFGKPKAPEPAPIDPAVAWMRGVAESHNLSARFYETAAGYRLIVTNAPFKAGSDETEALLGEFRADPLYMRLCRMQESFRARLTPKPFRIEYSNPPVEFPFETPADQAKQDRWVAGYEAKSAPFATCRFMETFGATNVLPEFEELVRFHDEATKANRPLGLA